MSQKTIKYHDDSISFSIEIPEELKDDETVSKATELLEEAITAKKAAELNLTKGYRDESYDWSINALTLLVQPGIWIEENLNLTRMEMDHFLELEDVIKITSVFIKLRASILEDVISVTLQLRNWRKNKDE